MFCSISGQAPEKPVISTKSGHLFERELAEKYITETGKDPVTGDEMTVDDLVDLKVNESAGVKPRANTTASIPGLLTLMQNEWDALMLETFSLRKHVDTIRQELSHALYQHDAACRVIARLSKERDTAREALANAQAQGAQLRQAAQPAVADAPSAAVVPKPGNLPQDVSQAVEASAASLSKDRKSKKHISPSLASGDVIKSLTVLSSNPIHKSVKPGITAVAFDPAQPTLLASGGVDADVQLFDFSQGRVLYTLAGHLDRITGVALRPMDGKPSMVVSTSRDRTARVWKLQGDVYVTSHVVDVHNKAVSGVAIHPTNRVFAVSSLDNTWSLHDFENGRALARSEPENAELNCIQFHPDGLLLAAGAEDGRVHIWQLLPGTKAVTFNAPTPASAVTSIAFSNNGFYLATGLADGRVCFWDLRKAQDSARSHFLTISPTEDSSAPITDLVFDESGSYFAVSQGTAIKTFRAPKRAQGSYKAEFLGALQAHTQEVKAIAWGRDATMLASAAMDRTLRVWGSSS